MLYLAKCKECNHLLFASHSHTLKQRMADHLSVSHNQDYGLVADVPLKDFETFTITRVKHNTEFLKNLLNQKRFWHFYRNLGKLAEARTKIP